MDSEFFDILKWKSWYYLYWNIILISLNFMLFSAKWECFQVCEEIVVSIGLIFMHWNNFWASERHLRKFPFLICYTTRAKIWNQKILDEIKWKLPDWKEYRTVKRRRIRKPKNWILPIKHEAPKYVTMLLILS